MNINQIIQAALKEDRVRDDITTRLLVSSKTTIQAQIIFREDGVLCAGEVAAKVFKAVDPSLKVKVLLIDGKAVKKNQSVLSVSGRANSILKAERTALNFVSYLSGIATRTQEYVSAVKSHKVKILDTRKTTPLMRDLEKYAVTCGGGTNHRRDLSEMVLIKDNHLMSCRGMKLCDVVRAVRKKTSKKIEIEVDNLQQFSDALEGKPDMILLDNMSCADMKKAVAINQKILGAKRPLLEASGGITLKNIRQVAGTGVDRISIGALTHSHQSINVSLEF